MVFENQKLKFNSAITFTMCISKTILLPIFVAIFPKIAKLYRKWTVKQYNFIAVL